VTHFVDVYPSAVCGHHLGFSARDTSNAFAHVSCPQCRDWLREHRLRPGGFADPEEWSTQRVEPVQVTALRGMP
jgi:hypothetical protein